MTLAAPKSRVELLSWADTVIELQRKVLELEAEVVHARWVGNHELARDLRARLSETVSELETAKAELLAVEVEGLSRSKLGPPSAGRPSSRG